MEIKNSPLLLWSYKLVVSGCHKQQSGSGPRRWCIAVSRRAGHWDKLVPGRGKNYCVCFISVSVVHICVSISVNTWFSGKLINKITHGVTQMTGGPSWSTGPATDTRSPDIILCPDITSHHCIKHVRGRSIITIMGTMDTRKCGQLSLGHMAWVTMTIHDNLDSH